MMSTGLMVTRLRRFPLPPDDLRELVDSSNCSVVGKSVSTNETKM